MKKSIFLAALLLFFSFATVSTVMAQGNSATKINSNRASMDNSRAQNFQNRINAAKNDNVKSRIEQQHARKSQQIEQKRANTNAKREEKQATINAKRADIKNRIESKKSASRKR